MTASVWAQCSVACHVVIRRRRKSLGMLLRSSCPQDGMLTWPIRIVDCKLHHGNGFSPGFQCCQRLGAANRCAILCFTWVLEASNEHIGNECMHGVTTIANYSCIIDFIGTTQMWACAQTLPSSHKLRLVVALTPQFVLTPHMHACK